MRPYEEDISRVRAMYRLPTVPPRNRLLELCFAAPSIMTGYAWPGERVVTCHLRARGYEVHAAAAAPAEYQVCIADHSVELPFADGSFDLVIFHRGLGFLLDLVPAMRSRGALTTLFRRVARVLSPGGVFAVSARNATLLTRWKRSMQAPGQPDSSGSRGLSIKACRNLFAAGQFQDIETFNVLPHRESPLRLVNTETPLTRVGFRRELQSNRSALSLPAYATRRVVVEFALNRHLEESIIGWGRR